MIQKFIERFTENKVVIHDWFTKYHPEDYKQIVQKVVEIISDEDGYYEEPDPSRIHEINDGDYQGTLVYIIPERGYQPGCYWAVKVNYGSCSVCDTLEGIRNYSDEPPSEQQVKDYMMLSLHVVQGIKEI